MGIDLTLCPIEYPRLDSWLGHERISVRRDYRIFGQIDGFCEAGAHAICHPRPLPEWIRFRWYGDDGLEVATEDPYGTPLTYAMTGALCKVSLPKDATPWNRAVWAFLAALPDDTPVVLWWH